MAVALQLALNAAILVLLLYVLLVLWRAVQQQQDRSHFVAASEIFQDEPRENPWVGFLQEPMTSLRVGAIGSFQALERDLPKAPMYMIQ
jgi:hypothetical protein